MEFVLESLTLIILLKLLHVSPPPVLLPWFSLTISNLDDLHYVFSITHGRSCDGLTAAVDGVYRVQEILIRAHDLNSLNRYIQCLRDAWLRAVRRSTVDQSQEAQARAFLASRYSRLQGNPERIAGEIWSSLRLHSLHWIMCEVVEMHGSLGMMFGFLLVCNPEPPKKEVCQNVFTLSSIRGAGVQLWAEKTSMCSPQKKASLTHSHLKMYLTSKSFLKSMEMKVHHIDV